LKHGKPDKKLMGKTETMKEEQKRNRRKTEEKQKKRGTYTTSCNLAATHWRSCRYGLPTTYTSCCYWQKQACN